jgi:hypothetical protein
VSDETVTAEHVVSLFDRSAVMLKPWRDTHTCWAVDITHPVGITERDGINLVRHDLRVPWLPPFDRDDIAFVAAFPPCDHLAISGARWFTGKGLRVLAESVTYFATSVEFVEWTESKWLIENPVSTMSTYWRPPDHSFHPWQYAGLQPAENYTKKTCLWTGGGFVMPPPAALPPAGLFGGQPPDDQHILAANYTNGGDLRSQTPMGFALAVYEANL